MVFGLPHVEAISIDSFQPATNALGQDDGLVSTPTPIYTKGTANNAAHKLGLSAPVIGVALDPTDHRLFVADTSNHRVLVYGLTAGNLLVDRIPDNVLGQANFWANATLGLTQAGMGTPNGIAFDDANNRLFVTQGVSTTRARVTVYDVTSITDGEDAVNVLGQTTFTASTAAVTQEGLSLPTGVAYDSTNQRLFVAQNSGNRVSVFDVASIDDGEPATGVLGQANFTASTAATTQAGMNAPFDVALSGSTAMYLFVSEGTSNRVVVYDVTAVTNGENAIKVLGQANFTTATAASTQAGMNSPRGISYAAAAKKLYVSQSAGNRVTVYTTSDGLTDGENAVSVLGQATFVASTAATTQAGLNVPTGAFIDTANNYLYVPQSSASRLSIFDVASITDGENAVDALGQSDDSLSAPVPIYTKTTAQNASHKLGLSGPLGITLDTTNHRLFVSDTSNNRVLVYNLTAGNLATDRIPDNVLGQAFFYTNAVGTTQSTLSAPNGLAFDPTGNRLFVSDLTNNRILVYDTASITDGENAVNVLGQVVFTVATAATTQLGLSAPRQIAYDTTSKMLYVADSGNSRIMIFDATTVVDGENAVNALGQDDGLVSSPTPIYTKATANNAAHKLGLSAPVIGIVMDTVDHRLFVSDTVNNRVLEYDLNNSNILSDRTPDHVLGQLNFYANAAATTRGGLNVPNGLAYDSTGKRLFVAQTTGDRVTIYDVATIVDGEDAINVLGQTTYTAFAAATTQAGLNVPTGIVYDGTNKRLFVAQNSANRVSVFDLSTGAADYPNADNALGQYDDSLSAPGPIYTKSTAHNGPNKLGISAPIVGVVMDTGGHRLFLSDTGNNRVLVYNLDSNNALLDRIPDNVLGQVNFYSNAAASTQTGFETPNGIDFDDANNRLFVAEGAGSRVKVFDTASITDGENAVNVLGQVNFVGTTAATTQVGMSQPMDVTLDEINHRLYVSDNTLNRVTVYDVTSITDGENAVSVLGQTTYVASTAATTQVGMNVPFGLALSGSTAASYLFVAQGTANRVTVYDVTSITDGENAVKVLGQANFTTSTAASTQAGMNAPRGIAYNSANKMLYVSQTTGNRVTVNDVATISDGENAVSVLGQTNFTNSTTATTQAGMNAPTGTYVDIVNSKLYVPQSGANRVGIYDVASITDGENSVDQLAQYDDNLTTPGPIYTKSTAHNGPSILGLSAGIIGLALDPTDHRLFVSDTGNNRVLEYNLDNNDLLSDRIPDHVLGQTNFYSNAAASTQVGMNVPNGIAYDDPSNRLFVAQPTGNRVTVYDVAAITDGENAINVLGQANFTAFAAASTQVGMNVPTGVAYGGSGSRLYVAQNSAHRVTAYNIADGITDGENAVAVLGQTNFTNTAAATTQAGMNQPFDVTISGSLATTLFVSQGTADRVTTYDVTQIANGENAVHVLGQADFVTSTAASTQAGMNVPRGLSYDATNKKLYVAQTTGARVTVYNVAASITDGANAINVYGQPTFVASTASVVQEGLSTPTGVLADPAHNRIYVMDSTTSRVLSYPTNAGIGNGENATGVLGQADFVTSTAATTQAGMNVPYDVTLSGSTAQTLFVSQGTANRVTTYEVTVVTNGESAQKVLGQADFVTSTAASTQAGMNAPRGIAYNAATKTLFVTQTTGNRVTTYDVAASITNGANAIKVLGQPGFTLSAASTRQAGLNAPNGVYVDATSSYLYVLQSGASRVSIYDVASITDAENAVDVLGQTDSTLNPPGPIYTKGTANNAAYKLGLSAPNGVAVDPANHRLFVADSTNNRILVYNMNASNILLDTIPDNVLGQLNFWANAVATTQAGLSSPVALTFDTAGNRLFASDVTNSRVLVYDTASITDGENAVAVLGQPNFTTATAGTTQLGLSSPRQIVYDTVSGQLFVADGGNSRIIMYSVNAPINGGDSFHFFGF